MNPKSTLMISKSSVVRAAGVFLLGMIALTATVRAAVLYEQPFSNTSGAVQTVGASGSGWQVYQNGNATNQTTNNTLWFVHNVAGYQGSTGFLFRKAKADSGSSTSAISLAFTVLNDPISVSDVGSFSVVFRTVATNTPTVADALYFAVQIDSQWYVSTTAVAPTAIGAGSSNWAGAAPTEVVFNPAVSAWNKLTFAAGSSLVATSIAAEAPLSGTITAVGLFFPNQSSIDTYIDQFQVNGTSAIPEPSTAAIVGGAVVLGFSVLRRRKVARA